MAEFSGFFESQKPPQLGDTCGILLAHRDGHQNGSKVGVFFIVVLLIAALVDARAICSE